MSNARGSLPSRRSACTVRRLGVALLLLAHHALACCPSFAENGVAGDRGRQSVVHLLDPGFELLMQAQKRQAANKVDEALELVERVLGEYADNADLVRRAHVMRLDILVSARRFEEAERSLKAYCRWIAAQSAPEPVDGVAIPWRWMALIHEWSGRMEIAKGRGGLTAALAALERGAHDLTGRLARDTALSDECRARIHELLLVEPAGEEAGLHIRFGDYRGALEAVRRLESLADKPELFEFPGSGAERDRVRRVLDHLSSRVPVGVVVQEYCEAWRDGKHEVMYALCTRRFREAQTQARFAEELRQAAQQRGRLVEAPVVFVATVEDDSARATAWFIFEKEETPGGAGVQKELRLRREEGAWRIDEVRDAEPPRPRQGAGEQP